MNINQMTYAELCTALKEPESELFGGAVAYLTIDLSLALFAKIMRRKAKKTGSRAHTYETLGTLAETVGSDARKAACDDGVVFQNIMNRAYPEKDLYIENVVTQQISFITNLSTIQGFLSMLLQETKNSLKSDFVLIKENLHTAKDNLVSIIKFEVGRMEDDFKKATLEGEITKL